MCSGVICRDAAGMRGRIEQSELTYGDGMIFVGRERTGSDVTWQAEYKSPLSVGGANIVSVPDLHDYGADYWADRSYGAVDPEGHLWWFTQRIRDPRP